VICEVMKTQTLAQALKALSDPTRLSVIDMLMEGVQCNCEIAESLGLSLSLISHHLRVLRQVGLVQSERDPEDARWVYYSIDQEALTELNQAMNHLLDVNRIQPRLPSCGPRKCNQC
jgi:ArsR family transcriptional regulator